jgi:hypothetical protein
MRVLSALMYVSKGKTWRLVFVDILAQFLSIKITKGVTYERSLSSFLFKKRQLITKLITAQKSVEKLSGDNGLWEILHPNLATSHVRIPALATPSATKTQRVSGPCGLCQETMHPTFKCSRLASFKSQPATFPNPLCKKCLLPKHLKREIKFFHVERIHYIIS